VSSSPPRSLRTLAIFAVGALVAAAGLQVLVVATNAAYLPYLNDFADGHIAAEKINDAIAAEDAVGNVAVAQLICFVAAGLFFIAWFYRAYKNLTPFGAGADLTHTPGWAIGAWFIPIVNLFFPKAIANDIWRGTVRARRLRGLVADDGGPVAVPALLNWWWAFWVLTLVASRVASWEFSKASDTVDQTQSATSQFGLSFALEDITDAVHTQRIAVIAQIVGAVAAIAAAVLAIKVVRAITADQQQAIDAAS
jgi:hypothetical protein